MFTMLFISAAALSQTSCPGFTTYTQGGWGTSPSGNNVGTFLNNNFAANFPAATGYLTIGWTGTGGKTLTLTSATAVRNFLPSGTTPFVLTTSLTNPTRTSYPNVLAGQLVALALNLRFDNNISSYGSSSTNLRNLVIASGPFMGKTVQFLFDNANLKIGGSAAAFNKTLSEYTTALDNVNKNYDNGTNAQSFLACPLTASCTTVPVLCYGTNTGSMTAVANGGRAPFSYVWSGGVAGNVATATGLYAGTYSVTITDACGQTATTSCTVTQNTLLVVSSSAGQILCNGGTTNVTVSATGGRTPYTGTGTFTVGAGTYNYTVTDAVGCSKTTSITVNQPTALVANASAGQILCYGGTTTVEVSATGGTAPYSGTGSFTVGAGSYNYTVTDANGCSKQVSVVVTQPSLLEASISAGQILCNGGTTTVEVSATGGTAPYSGTGSFTVGAGVYNYTVTDANGCSKPVSVSVTEPTQLVAAAISSGSILCNGGTTTITVSATGGTADYTGTGTFTEGAGFYTYDVSDANGCPASVSVNVTQPAPLVASVSLVERIRCNNECNGALNSSVSGGTPAYSYLWSNGATTATISGLCSDGYYLVVTDANGCVALSNGYGLDNPEVLELSAILTVEDDQCGDDVCTGAASVEVSGGEPDYTFVWTGGESDSNELTGLCESAVVSVTVTDARGCVVSSEDATITCVEQECGPHRTYTQGGWGAPRVNPATTYLRANFDAAFPSGLTIGCDDNSLTFYTAQEIVDFLPEGGTPDTLPNLTVLAGQLVAATLNANFDAFDNDFAGSSVALGDMFIDATGFEGMTVSEILDAANVVIGGCSDSYEYAALNVVLTTINENFDNGTIDNGHLTCNNPTRMTNRSMAVAREVAVSSFLVNVYPNPAVDVANIQISTSKSETFEVSLYSLTGELVVKQQHSVVPGTTTLDLQVSELPSQMYVLRVASATQNKTMVVEVR